MSFCIVFGCRLFRLDFCCLPYDTKTHHRRSSQNTFLSQFIFHQIFTIHISLFSVELLCTYFVGIEFTIGNVLLSIHCVAIHPIHIEFTSYASFTFPLPAFLQSSSFVCSIFNSLTHFFFFVQMRRRYI